MFTHTINPILLTIGPLEIRYYGLIYALGFLITYFMIKYLARHRKIDLNAQHLDTLMIYIALGVIAGSRLFYVLFYNLTYYIHNPLDILALWHGGLSFHGGVVGAILLVFLFCKRYHYNFYTIADMTVIPTALALSLGRIANFINGELYGRITTLPWAVKFPGVDGFRHPSQLYEATKNFFLFTVLWYLRFTKLKKGTLTALFLIGYSTLRFFIELVREPELYVGLLTMGQFLSIFTLLIGVYIFARQ